MRIVAVLALSGLTVLGCTATGSETWDIDFQAAGTMPEELAVFDTTIMAFMQEHGISAGAVAVTMNGRLVGTQGYTYQKRTDDIVVDPTSLFRIASISKPVTAVGILKLVGEGRLSLEDRLVDLLEMEPAAGETMDARMNQVTVRHLLEHLGGWDRNIAFDPMFHDSEISEALGLNLPISQSDIVTFMNGQELQNDPGSTYAYSNYGYLLLGRIIEEVTQSQYDEFIRTQVLAHLGIEEMRIGRTLRDLRLPNEVAYDAGGGESSVFDPGGPRVPSAYGAWNLENMDSHGAWLASAVDLARFASSFDRTSAHPVLSEMIIEQMFGFPENLDPSSYNPPDLYYALGWFSRQFEDGSRNTWHGGSLPGTHTLMVRRRDGLGWVILFNQRGEGFGEIDGLLHQAANAVTDWPDHDLFESN